MDHFSRRQRFEYKYTDGVKRYSPSQRILLLVFPIQTRDVEVGDPVRNIGTTHKYLTLPSVPHTTPLVSSTLTVRPLFRLVCVLGDETGT